MTFENIPPLLDEALTARGYTALTPVQTAVIAEEAVGRDLVVSAQTGSGKTVAFGLAMAPQILDGGLVSLAREPAALIIAPTRELALQVSRELMWLYAKAGVRIATCVGGMDASKERRTLNQGAQIVVGTPGRLRDHLERGALDLSALKVAILDEADEMLSVGFKDQIYNIFQYLSADIQVGLFSATMPNELQSLTDKFMRNPVRILVKSEMLTLEGIKQYYVALNDDNQKYATLKDIFNIISMSQCIIYCNSIKRVMDLTDAMINDGFPVCCIHSNMDKSKRDEA